MDNIDESLKTFISEQFLLDQPGFRLEKHTNLIEGGIIDSLGIFILIDFIGQSFGVNVAPDQVTLENFQSIEAIRKLVLSNKT